MTRKKIAIIGVGGRTGTMFAFELKKYADILGVARKKEVDLVQNKKLYIEKGDGPKELFEERIIEDSGFSSDVNPDFIFITTKNPISASVRYYFEKFKHYGPEEIPALLISQNGISAISDAQKALKDVFGEKAEKIRLIRVILFNPINKKHLGDKVYIKYFLPLRIAVAKASGEGGIKDIVDVFKLAGFDVEEFSPRHARDLEFSKLFLNLIGMGAASRGFSIRDGFQDKEIFKEELGAIKEYIKVVKLSKGKFVNFSKYPVGTLAFLFGLIPVSLLVPFRKFLAQVISKGRGGKPKDLDEISYYNGAVVGLGKKAGVATPINKKICDRISNP